MYKKCETLIDRRIPRYKEYTCPNNIPHLLPCLVLQPGYRGKKPSINCLMARLWCLLTFRMNLLPLLFCPENDTLHLKLILCLNYNFRPAATQRCARVEGKFNVNRRSCKFRLLCLMRRRPCSEYAMARANRGIMI